MRRVATLAMLSLLVVPGAYAQDAETAESPEAAAVETEAAPAAETETETETAAEEPAAETVEASPAEPEPTAEPAAEEPAVEEPAAEEPVADDSPIDVSTDLERIIVSGVAGGVAVAGLAAGITFGVLALNDYNCLSDVVACNADRDEPIIGEDYLDARAEVERMALYADMGFLVAATAATVAIVGAVELLLGSDSEAAE